MKKTDKAPHPARLNALDLAQLNAVSAQLDSARFELKAHVLEMRVRELEHLDAMRVKRDDAQAMQGRVRFAETAHKELGAKLAKAYDIDLKRAAIMPETGDITTHTLEG